MSYNSSPISSGFIDLATYDELEKYIYGGQDATAYFVRETRKSTWFSTIPVVLQPVSGTPDFDSEFSVSISRAGDYLLNTWIRLGIPTVSVAPSSGLTVRWTKNFMHNLIQEASFTCNDLVVARFDNYHLDFWNAFTMVSTKSVGYDVMIGNNNSSNIPATTQGQTVLNLPLPFFFSRDSGVALPTAALPYCEMKLNFTFRDWTDLLSIDQQGRISRPATLGDLNAIPHLLGVQVWGEYALVSNEERKKMACAPRDILIEQAQSLPIQTVLGTSLRDNFDMRFSQAVKVVFFGIRNATVSSLWSNYTTATPYVNFNDTQNVFIDLQHSDGLNDPIGTTSLIYENTNRLYNMGSDYFSLVNPWYHAPAIPTDTGYHMYSYSLDFYDLDPMGSTNYGKLTNVSMLIEYSSTFKAIGSGTYPGQIPSSNPPANYNNQKYTFIMSVVNNNIIRISGGSLGFPVL